MGRASRKKGQRLKEPDLQGETPVLHSESGHFLTRLPVVLLLLSLLVFLIYGKTLSFPFVFDDANNIVENSQIRNLANFFRLSGTRDVGYLTFALNYHLGRLSVFGYHLVNILIHITNGFLVYSLVWLLFQPSLVGQAQGPAPTNNGRYAPTIALATALLFVAHPIQTQAVTYIVQRFASLVTLFYLLAVVGYLKWRLGSVGARRAVPLRWLWYLVALISTVLAMKTKENSFTIPLMILLVELVFLRFLIVKPWKTLIPFFLTLLIIPLAMGNPLNTAFGELEKGFAQDLVGSRSEYLFTQFRVIVTYLRLLVLPIHQSVDYHYPIYHSFFQPAVFIPFLFLLGLFVFAIRHIGRIGPIRLISFGILWFFLTLSIESSIIPIEDVIFEHRLYLPSVGIFLAICLLASQIRVPLAISFFIAISVLSIMTYRRNLVWSSPVTLWQDAVAKAPGKARAHGNLGSALETQGRIDEAMREYQTALTLKPDYSQALNNLGGVFMARGHVEDAIRAYQTTLKLDPDVAEAHYNLGLAFAAQGRPDSLDKAIQEYQAALKLKPDYAKAHLNLGTVYATQNRLEEATVEFEAAVKLNPDSAQAHNNLGNVYMLQGRLKEAIEHYQEALRLKPDFGEAAHNRDLALKKLENSR
ncbi:MAG: tetratricopeptide repeat protein [Deltaproteobacteria bacterium]|nr:tetratricopeptide repeat protein [Deltaproteobacteria bacterium]MBI4374659.1 tetratricopeptide repeat protein [Deltaproteobacteria bacterium]